MAEKKSYGGKVSRCIHHSRRKPLIHSVFGWEMVWIGVLLGFCDMLLTLDTMFGPRGAFIYIYLSIYLHRRASIKGFSVKL